jgi:prepilin-type N-terminal cleavage/methylation domain-containing protein
MMRPRTTPSIRRGFTLIECIATIVVLAIIGTVASNIMLTAVDGYTDAAVAAQLNTEASITLDRIVRELRSIEPDPDESENFPHIQSVMATEINWNDDCTIELSGTNLMLTEDGGAASVLQSDVAAFDISTFDEDNSALGASLSGSSCHDIRRIQITLGIERDGVTETLRTRVFVRAAMQ